MGVPKGEQLARRHNQDKDFCKGEQDRHEIVDEQLTESNV
jgi:hypothetical protein